MREQSHRLIRPHPALAAGVLLLRRVRAAGPPDRARRPRPPRSTSRRKPPSRRPGPTRPRRRTACARWRRRTRTSCCGIRRAGTPTTRSGRRPDSSTTAFQTSADSADRQQAERLLKWLKQEYPSSPFVKRVDGALQALGQAPAGAAAASSTPPPPLRSANTPPASPPVPTTLPASGPAAVVKGITASVLPHGERITIEFSKEVAFTGDRVENPDRVFFDFANATAPASLLDHAPDAERDARQSACASDGIRTT